MREKKKRREKTFSRYYFFVSCFFFCGKNDGFLFSHTAIKFFTQSSIMCRTSVGEILRREMISSFPAATLLLDVYRWSEGKLLMMRCVRSRFWFQFHDLRQSAQTHRLQTHSNGRRACFIHLSVILLSSCV